MNNLCLIPLLFTLDSRFHFRRHQIALVCRRTWPLIRLGLRAPGAKNIAFAIHDNRRTLFVICSSNSSVENGRNSKNRDTNFDT